MVFVYQFASGDFSLFFFRTRVYMNFRARSAWSGIAHFPEVIMFVTVDDMIFGEIFAPISCCFVVAFQSFLRAAFEYGNVEVFRIDFQNVYQVLVCPSDNFFLEVVAERPVTKHLEHGVVVSIMPYFFQVVMLTAYAQTFL